MLRVMDVATGEQVDGPIDRARYSPVAWLPGGEAFYYVRRLPPDQVPDGEEQYHRRVWLHRVGTDRGRGRRGLRRRAWTRPTTTASRCRRDGRWLTVSASAGTAPRNDLWLADLTGVRPRPRPTWWSCRRASTRRPACTSAGTGGCTCSPTATRRAAGSRSTGPSAPDVRHLAATCCREDARRCSRASRSSTARSSAGRSCWPPGPGTRSARSPCTTWPPASRGGQIVPLPGLGHHRRAARAPRGRPRGLVRLHRPHHAGRGATATTRAPARSRLLGERPGTVDGARRAPPSSRLPVQGRHRRCGCSWSSPGPRPARTGRGPTILYGYGGFGIAADPGLLRRRSWPGSRPAASTRSPTCAAAARRARTGTAPACASTSRTCSTTSTPRPRR